MAANPFGSDWLAGGRDERLRPQGTLSYVAGSTDEPLRFITISQQLDKTVAATARATRRSSTPRSLRAVVVRPEAARRRDGRRPARARPAPRQPRRHLGAEPARVDRHPVRDRADRPRPGQHQPGLPHDRAGVRAQQGRLPRARHGARASRAATTSPCSARSRPRSISRARARCSTACACPSSSTSSCSATGRCRRAAISYRRSARARRPGAARAARRAERRARPRRRDQHPVHQRNDRLAEGRDAHRTSTSSTTRATAPRRWRSAPTTSSASRCRSTTASAWCSACSAPPPSGATMVFPGESFDAGDDAALDRQAPLHRAARRADDVRRDARARRASRASTCRSCAPASWPARRARSRPCAR